MNSGSGAVICCAKPTTEAGNNTKEINNFILLILYVIFLMQRYKKTLYIQIFIYLFGNINDYLYLCSIK